MEWLKTIAPMLGTALGGPLGGAAAAFVADKLGLSEKTVDAVTSVLQSGQMTADQITQVNDAQLYDTADPYGSLIGVLGCFPLLRRQCLHVTHAGWLVTLPRT